MAQEESYPDIAVTLARRDRVKELFFLFSEIAPLDRELLLESDPSLTDEERLELRMLLSMDSAEGFFDELSKAIGSLAMADRAFAPGDLVASRFRVLRFLGAGGMGEVYSADDLELRCRVALKVLRPALALQEEFVDRFRTEIRLSRTVVSAHVCRVFDVARHAMPGRPDTVFYTVELLDGETLAARIRREGPLSADCAKRVALHLLQGMDAAHGFGVLHCDFKSANVMLCDSGEGLRAVITDFGLARSLIEQAVVGEFAYTPAYASPEQINRRALSKSSDVFSLGVVLFELATGQLPFDGEDRTTLRLPKSIDGSWKRVVMSCLDILPEKRPVDLSKLALELGAGHSRRWFIAAGAAVALPAALLWKKRLSPPLPSILVRPFLSDKSEAGAGMANATSNRIADLLTKLPGLRVISQGAVLAGVPAQNSADYLISGNVRTLPSSLEMRLELTDNSGNALWSQTRTGQPPQLETMYREAVLTVAQKLHLTVNLERFDARFAGTPPEAYQKYLLARYHAENRDLPSIKESIKQLREAIAIAPEFAAAHAWLGMCLYLLTAEDKQENRFSLHAQADRSARRSLELDPRESDAHIVLGLNDHLHNYDWTGSEAHFREAIELSPSGALAHHRLARLLSHLTRHSEAVQQMDQAVVMDFGTTLKIGRGMVLSAAGRTNEAIAELEAVASSDPGHFNIYVPLSSAYHRAGRLQDAFNAAMQAVTKSAQVTEDRKPMSFALAQAGYLQAQMGQHADATKTQSELQSRFLSGSADACEVAFLPAGFERADETLLWLERGYVQRSVSMATLLSDPMYRFLAGNARFERLLSTLGLRK